MAEQIDKLGYRFSDTGLLEQALTHRSAGNRNNERLEFLGDSILNFTITRELFDLRPDAPEGDLSRIRASLVNRETLAEIATELELTAHLRLGQGERKSGGQRRNSIQANTVEALFGAILLDSDMESCRRVILTLYRERLGNLPDAESLKDPKTRLQEHLQSRGTELPEYRIVQETGKDHKKHFEVHCIVAGMEPVAGEGSSRRKAEQQAATRALSLLKDV